MKALVTGAAGFIGLNLCMELQKRGYDVVGMDNIFGEHTTFLQDTLKIPFVYCEAQDIASQYRTKIMRKKFDVVFHLAVICLEECMAKPVYGYRENTIGTLQTVRWALAKKVFMVYVSSCEAYGNCKMDPEGGKPYRGLAETDLLQPRSVYGASKAAGEHITRAYFYNKTPLQYLILRPFNTFGPYAREDKYAMVVTKFIQRLRKGQKPLIHGGGQQTREWNYVDDTVRGIIECYEKRDVLSLTPVINICSGKETSVTQLYQELLRATNCFLEPKYTKRRPNDVQQLFGDGTLAELLVDFYPRISLTEGLRKYVEWWDETYG